MHFPGLLLEGAWRGLPRCDRSGSWTDLSLPLPDANSINLSAVLARFTGVLGADDLDDDLEILGEGDGVADLGSLLRFCP